MCTTLMVLTTIALILRQWFSNRIQPQGDTGDEDAPHRKSNGAAETPRRQQ